MTPAPDTPKQPVDQCHNCDGSGLVAWISTRTTQTGESEFAPCPACRGTGFVNNKGPDLGRLFVETGSPAFPFMRSATVADLVSALRAEGVLVIQKDTDGHWPERIVESMADIISVGGIRLVLDALAEAQPFPPAGGVS